MYLLNLEEGFSTLILEVIKTDISNKFENLDRFTFVLMKECKIWQFSQKIALSFWEQ